VKVSDASEIERDQWGRPLIVNPGTGRKEAYSRISTVASALEEAWDLVPWKVAHAARGLREHDDLWEQFLAAPNAKTRDAVIEEAMDAAGANVKRDWGSAVHDAVHAINTGLPYIGPDFLADDLRAYKDAVAELQFVECEAFGVVHSMAIAGSWDAKVRCPDGKVRVADLKTGRYKPQSCRIQLAAYALAENYQGETVPVEQDFGIVINLPGDGKCTLYKADLERGRNELQFALTLRQYRSFAKSERVEVLSWPRQEGWLEALIAEAKSVEECRALWAQHRAVWTAEHTGLVNARLLALGG
jgi:hypothetical protein